MRIDRLTLSERRVLAVFRDDQVKTAVTDLVTPTVKIERRTIHRLETQYSLVRTSSSALDRSRAGCDKCTAGRGEAGASTEGASGRKIPQLRGIFRPRRWPAPKVLDALPVAARCDVSCRRQTGVTR
jgi:hypothetical protein